MKSNRTLELTSRVTPLYCTNAFRNMRVENDVSSRSCSRSLVNDCPSSSSTSRLMVALAATFSLTRTRTPPLTPSRVPCQKPPVR